MQNVNINQEVENAMMAPSQQPRGIVDLLASELKARDAKARNQLNTMMAPAPDPNTIISQNEKETENNVSQQSFVGKFLSSIRQKMYGKRKF